MKSQISDMKIQISDAHLQVPGQISYVSDISGIHCPQIQMRYLVSGNLSVSVSAQALPKNSIFKKLTKKRQTFLLAFKKYLFWVTLGEMLPVSGIRNLHLESG